MESLEQLLPQSFTLYHTGQVTLSQNPRTEDFFTPEKLLELKTIVFKFLGDRSGSLILAFDQLLDDSLYTELGNIIASQIATAVSDADAVVWISPPLHISNKRVEQILSTSSSPLFKTYTHHTHNSIIPVGIALVLSEQGDTVNV